MSTVNQNLAQVEHQIHDLRSQVLQINDQIKITEEERSKLNEKHPFEHLKVLYLQFTRKFRSFKEVFFLWPVAVLVIGPMLTGLITMVFCDVFFGSFSLSTISFFVGIVFPSVLIALALFYPDRATLEKSIKVRNALLATQIRAIREFDQSLENFSQRIDALGKPLTILNEKREALLSSSRHKRDQLLQLNWKAMRDTEWEGYLAAVFQELGAYVELTKKVGDQGVDLLVTMNGKKIAVQAKGYHNSVSNAAVQQAVAGMAHYSCNGCAVITNSRFTKSAEELAASNRCKLIGEEDLPALVMGELEF